ncbi:MAG: PEGA domain-containing protein, partial [Polyangiaceae bacterium]|nr:PEGA domain-containing protein [Polyangiaceae bacterium]
PEPAPAAKAGGSRVVGGLVILALVVVGGYFGLRSAGVIGGAQREAARVTAPAAPSRETVAIADEAAPVEPEIAVEDEAAEPTAPAEPAAPPVEVRVESTPPGAEIRLGETVLGETPAVVSLPIGELSTLTLKARGYAAAAVEVTPEERTPPVRVELEQLPYVVHVESAPSGATARAGGAQVTTPGDLRLARGTSNVMVRVTLPNHATATEAFPRSVFVEEDGTMRHSVAVTLSRVAVRAEPAVEGESGGAAPTPAPAPAPAPEASAP